MAENPGGSSNQGSNNTLFFIVGGLVVIAGVFVFLFTNGYIDSSPKDVNVNVEAPAAPAAPTEAAPAQPAPSTNQ